MGKSAEVFEKTREKNRGEVLLADGATLTREQAKILLDLESGPKVVYWELRSRSIVDLDAFIRLSTPYVYIQRTNTDWCYKDDKYGLTDKGKAACTEIRKAWGL